MITHFPEVAEMPLAGTFVGWQRAGPPLPLSGRTCQNRCDMAGFRTAYEGLPCRSRRSSGYFLSRLHAPRYPVEKWYRAAVRFSLYIGRGRITVLTRMDWDKARIYQRVHDQGTVFAGTGQPPKPRKKKRKSIQLQPGPKVNRKERIRKRLSSRSHNYLIYVLDILDQGGQPTSVPRELRLEVDAAGGPEQWALLQAPYSRPRRPNPPARLRKRSEVKSPGRTLQGNRVKSTARRLLPATPNAVVEDRQVTERFRAYQRRRRKSADWANEDTG